MFEYLPAILTAIIAFLTLSVNLWMNAAKNKLDRKSLDRSADNELRDDLLERSESLQKQIEYKDLQISNRDAIIDKKNERIDLLQQSIAQQSEKILDLTLTLKQKDFDLLDCNKKVIELQKVVAQIERKVYYIREIAKPDEEKTGEVQNNG